MVLATAIGPAILGGIVPHLLLRLISGAGDVDSAAPSSAMWALSRLDANSGEFAAGFEAFLAEYEEPPIDPSTKDELIEFVARRTAEGGVPVDY